MKKYTLKKYSLAEYILSNTCSLCLILLLSGSVFNSNLYAQRVVMHTLTNFQTNTSTGKFSFDVYSQSTGANSVRVGTTSYYINFNSTALNSPVISNVNPKYTLNSATGDYNQMTVQVVSGRIAITIYYSGNGSSTGDLLSTSSPSGELICTVTLNVSNLAATANISWDTINSAMSTPTLQPLTNNYSGSYTGVIGQRVVLHTLTNFSTNNSTGQYSFDIYSQSTGGAAVRVGMTSYYINFNSSALGSPVLSYINPKYTSGSSTGDYNPMTAQIVSGKIAITISYSGNGNGTGDILATSQPMGELICTVTMNVINPAANSNLAWDLVNSAMITPTYQTITNTYTGSDASPLPVELSEFTANPSADGVVLHWKTATEVNNYGFEVERKSKEWGKIGFVKGNGNSNSENVYSFTDNNLNGSGEFQYRLKQVDNNGKSKYYDVVKVTIARPKEYKLAQNSPNPFNPTTLIKFQIPENVRVRIKVYDILGKEVATLLNEDKQAGSYIVYWNGRDNQNQMVSSGIYLYSLQAGSFIETRKMNFMK